jgi:hypothetical protein
MYVVILFFPLVFSLVVGFIGRLFGVNGSRFLAVLGLFINLLITVILGTTVVVQQLSFHTQLTY